jgi:hypothetical protein
MLTVHGGHEENDAGSHAEIAFLLPLESHTLPKEFVSLDGRCNRADAFGFLADKQNRRNPTFHGDSVSKNVGPKTRPAWNPYSIHKARKGRFAMQPSPQTASASMPKPDNGLGQPSQAEDRVYQAVTVAAILLVLGSLWVF